MHPAEEVELVVVRIHPYPIPAIKRQSHSLLVDARCDEAKIAAVEMMPIALPAVCTITGCKQPRKNDSSRNGPSVTSIRAISPKWIG